MSEKQSSSTNGSPAVPAPFHANRRKLLIGSSAALVGALAFGGQISPLSIGDALAQTPGQPAARKGGDAIDLGEGDVGVLNYAYALEQLEAAFYTQVLKTPYSGIQSDVRDILTSIRDHEIVHRELFRAALKKNAIPDLEVDFTKIDFNSKDSVLSTAKTFEDLGVAAYNGAGQLLQNADYLKLAGKIVSVEARHAAIVAILIGNTGVRDDVVDDKGLDKALLPSEVLPKAAPFIKGNITAAELA